jgi:hypothetical protein
MKSLCTKVLTKAEYSTNSAGHSTRTYRACAFGLLRSSATFIPVRTVPLLSAEQKTLMSESRANASYTLRVTATRTTSTISAVIGAFSSRPCRAVLALLMATPAAMTVNLHPWFNRREFMVA